MIKIDGTISITTIREIIDFKSIYHIMCYYNITIIDYYFISFFIYLKSTTTIHLSAVDNNYYHRANAKRPTITVTNTRYITTRRRKDYNILLCFLNLFRQ